MLIDQKQAYLAVLIFSSILAWASFFGIIFFESPTGAGVLGVIILYTSFAVGLISLAILAWQLKTLKNN